MHIRQVIDIYQIINDLEDISHEQATTIIANIHQLARKGKYDSALHFAMERYDLRMVMLLLTYGEDPSFSHQGQKTPLHLAIENNDLAMVEAMLCSIEDEEELARVLQHSDTQGNTLIHLAKTQKMRELLANFGADKEMPNIYGILPREIGQKANSVAEKPTDEYELKKTYLSYLKARMRFFHFDFPELSYILNGFSTHVETHLKEGLIQETFNLVLNALQAAGPFSNEEQIYWLKWANVIDSKYSYKKINNELNFLKKETGFKNKNYLEKLKQRKATSTLLEIIDKTSHYIFVRLGDLMGQLVRLKIQDEYVKELSDEINELIKNGADLNSKQKDGKSILQSALWHDQYIIKTEWGIIKWDWYCVKAIFEGIKNSKRKMSDPDVCGLGLENFVEVVNAIVLNDNKHYNYFFSYLTEDEKKLAASKCFLAAVSANRLDEIKYLLTINPNIISEKHKDGTNCLHIAIDNKNVKMFKLLINQGAKSNNLHNESRIFGDTPEIELRIKKLREKFRYQESEVKIYNKEDEIFSLLNAIDKSFLSSLNKHLPRIKMLLQEDKTLLSKKNALGKTPLSLAIEIANHSFTNHWSLVAEMIQPVQDVIWMREIVNNGGYDAFKSLLNKLPDNKKSNLNVNQQDSHGNTALHYAVKQADLKMVEWLIANGADIFIQNRVGACPRQCEDFSRSSKIRKKIDKIFIKKELKLGKEKKQNDMRTRVRDSFLSSFKEINQSGNEESKKIQSMLLTGFPKESDFIKSVIDHPTKKMYKVVSSSQLPQESTEKQKLPIEEINQDFIPKSKEIKNSNIVTRDVKYKKT